MMTNAPENHAETEPLTLDLPLMPEAGQRGALGLASGSRLLAPLRAAVDRAETDARATLDAMDDDVKGTMAWDSCEDAIEHRNLCWLYNCRNDVKDNIWHAETLREGYDTWDPTARRKLIADMKRLLDALTHLIGCINHLERREAEELSANTVHEPTATARISK